MDEPNSASNTLDAIASVVPPAAQDRLKTDAAAVAGEAQQTFDTVKREAADQVSALRDQAQGQLAEATDKAKSFAAEQKDFAGDRLGGIADAVSKVADQLKDNDQVDVAGYARDLAGGVRTVSDSLKSRNVDELIAMAEDFGRKQPLAFLGAAALAGFVASRFVLASAQRRDAPPAVGRPNSAGRDASSAPATSSSASGDF